MRTKRKKQAVSEEYLQLKPGDRVSVEMDDGEVRVFVVKYSPWQLGHGDWVIGLEGIAGGYALDRVRGCGIAV